MKTLHIRNSTDKHWSSHPLWASLGVAAALCATFTPHGLAAESSSTPAASVVAASVEPLKWEAKEIEHKAVADEVKAHLQFHFTNTSPNEVIIQSARSSCFCTVASLPQQPWKIAPGTNGSIDVTMDLAGKRGTIQKPVYVETSAGLVTLLAKVVIPPPPSAPGQPTDTSFFAGELSPDRLKNLQSAISDRQTVFKNPDCVQCHATPAIGKMEGKALYDGVCAVCHDSEHRAPMVPNLKALNHALDLKQWRQWIAHSRQGSLMPAFAKSEGGPLEEAQVDVLASYLSSQILTPAAKP